jgi:hypothetical protein
MADFRKWILVLVAIGMMAGIASAQTTGLACTASAAVPPLLRAEGNTELSGDIILNCTVNGVTNTPTVATANFAIFYNTNVTSRILDNTTVPLSESLLFINDTPATTDGLTGGGVGSTTPLCSAATCAPYTTTPVPKTVFQGIASANQLQFIGVPVNPPGTNGTISFRITNVRVNAAGIGASATGIPSAVTALISITGPTSVAVNSPQQTVGFVSKSLNFSANVVNTATFARCNSIGRTVYQGYLRYQENFATAFKTRGVATQNSVGVIYQNVESGLVVPALGSTNSPFGLPIMAGLADYGTRLKATFNGIPSGVSVYVSDANLITGRNVAATIANTSYAALLVSELALTGNNAAATNTDFRAEGGAQVAGTQVALTGGSGIAVWEVYASDALSSENFDFGYWFSASANGAAATTTAGTVNGSYAPTPSSTGSTTAAYGSASLTLPIPRFADPTTTPSAIISVNLCRTNLLFPFVTSESGFDTGVAIANTSKDIFGNAGSAGACTLTFFGDTSPSSPAPVTVQPGTVWADTVFHMVGGPTFQGYIIAQCLFQYGHGFAFVTDLGARQLAMGYLALVIPDRPDGTRGSSITKDNAGAGEVLGQ